MFHICVALFSLSFWLCKEEEEKEVEWRREWSKERNCIEPMARLRFKKRWRKKEGLLVWVKRENCVRLVLARSRVVRHPQVSPPSFRRRKTMCERYALGLASRIATQAQTGYECSAREYLRHSSIGEAMARRSRVGNADSWWRIAQKTFGNPTKSHLHVESFLDDLT